ncbi:hypothetical protein FKM82_030126 [Ascaphus truei]
MPVNSPKPPKRPRLQRPASAGSLGTLSPASQQPHYTVLSPFTLAPVGHQFSLGSLGPQSLLRYATVLGKAGAADALALLTSAASGMQDQGALTEVMSPMELVAMESGLGSEGIGEEGQTIIQIDPAPDPEGGSKVMELGDGKVLGMQHHDGVHNVEIVVLEDD